MQLMHCRCRISRRRLNACVADWMIHFVDFTSANHEAPRFSIDLHGNGALLLTSHMAHAGKFDSLARIGSFEQVISFDQFISYFTSSRVPRRPVTFHMLNTC